MAQPFRQAKVSETHSFADIQLTYTVDSLIICSIAPYLCLSNAVWNGGLVQARSFVNWKVPLDFIDDSPEQAILKKIDSLGLLTTDTIGLMTAAKLTHASVHVQETETFRVFCVVTSGTSNAVRAGHVRSTYCSYVPGTVNVIVLIDAKMTEGALTNAIITITEAKTAALQDTGILDCMNKLAATGTTTDAVIIGCSQSETWPCIHRYAGTASQLGHALEMLVYQSVVESVRTQNKM